MTKATMTLVKTRRGAYYLRLDGDPGAKLLKADGDDCFIRSEVFPVQGVGSFEYDVNNLTSFWNAHAQLVSATKAAGLSIIEDDED